MRVFITGSAVVGALAMAAPAFAQAGRAGVITTLQGTATVARVSATEPTPLKFRDDVFVHDRITTGDQSVARILLGGKAVVTVRERSQITINESATTSTIEVTSGKIALAVNKTRMQPGESVEIKTPNAVAGIRGTVIIAEVSQTARGVTSNFTLLTGIVDVTSLEPGGRLSGARQMLKPLQTLGVTNFDPPTAPRAITRPEAQSIASEYRVNLREPSPGANAQVTERQVQEAARYTAALTDDANRTPARGKSEDTASNERAESEDGTKQNRGTGDDRGDTNTSDKAKSTSGVTGSAAPTNGGAVSNGGGAVSNGGGAVSNGGGAVSNGGGAASNGGGAASNGGGAVSNGPTGGGLGSGGGGGRIADRGIGGGGDLIGDKKNFGRRDGPGGSGGGLGGGIVVGSGDGGIGGDDLRNRDRLRLDRRPR